MGILRRKGMTSRRSWSVNWRLSHRCPITADMRSAIVSALLPLMRRMDPERAHSLALRALRLGLAGGSTEPDAPVLAITVLGRAFSNPIGLAAGFDKGAV